MTDDFSAFQTLSAASLRVLLSSESLSLLCWKFETLPTGNHAVAVIGIGERDFKSYCSCFKNKARLQIFIDEQTPYDNPAFAKQGRRNRHRVLEK
jgi:hypothetical protein